MKKESSKNITAMISNKQTTTMYIQYNLNFSTYLCMEKKKQKKYIILFYLFICRVAKFFQIRHYIKGLTS